MSTATEEVHYEAADGIASVTMQGPESHEAKNAQMAYALDAALRRAADDPDVKVIVLRCAEQHSSVGHEAGASGRAHERKFFRDMCLRWRELPKPTIAMVQGACIGSSLMLARACDLIIAAEDTVFTDPMMRGGLACAEFFAQADDFNPRIAKEFLFLGERMNAQRAYQMGMVNRVVARDFLEEESYCIAWRIAQMPAAGLSLVKQVVNRSRPANF